MVKMFSALRAYFSDPSSGNRKVLDFAVLIMIINFIQAAFTDLIDDEAYYWAYSQELDWGYFDHPPMVALIIRLGYLLIPSELGVRLVTILMQGAGIVIGWHMIDMKDKGRHAWRYCLILLTLPLFHIYGFITTPDVPLLFFTLIFLWIYKRHLKAPSQRNTLMWGVSMALLLYSKYHGVLVIFFILLSNLKLIRSRDFLVASGFGALLFIPHLIWQFLNDFPTFLYHLVERSGGFDINWMTDYLLNQLLVFSPFLFPVILYFLWKREPVDPFRKGLYFMATGFFVFFLFMSLKGHVEPHWLAANVIPVSIILFYAFEGREKLQKYFRVVAWGSGVIIIAARIVLCFGILPNNMEMQGNKIWAEDIKYEAWGRDVLFMDYKGAAKYAFYTGDSTHSVNNLHYRKNQYDLWNYDEQFKDKDIFFVSAFSSDNFTDYPRSNGQTFAGVRIDNFMPYQRVKIKYEVDTTVWEAGEWGAIGLYVHNPYPFPIELHRKNMPITFRGVFYRDNWIKHSPVMALEDRPRQLEPGTTYFWAHTRVPEEPGHYQFRPALRTRWMYEAFNSSKIIDVEVKPAAP